MSTPGLETAKAIAGVQELIKHLSRILETLDEAGLARAAIDIDAAIIQLTSVHDSLENAKDQTTFTQSSLDKIARIKKGVTLPRFDHFG